ncbi:MAG TPA: BTAD domain-containing putative transcriptional regulator [Marmoricola sp.]|nr:BTAD domain-containing putative transcriptional regulator [Marmoricola sp.]
MVALHALGAVRATADRVELPLGGPRQRRLLAVLLVHHGEVVSVDRVAEAVFAGAPTAAAGTTLRSYVARLRRVLAATGSSASVATRAPGYQLRVRPDDFDVTAFEASVTAAAAALDAGEPEQAVAAVREGLDLWQGRPYAEFEDEDWAYAESQRLLELRLTAHEVLVDAELALGHGNAVAPLLESLCTQQPLREAFRAQLMTAYYASGRQADALAAFRSFRQELAEELGIDPSPALVDLERRILRQDPELHLPGQRGSSLRGYQLGERLGTGSDGTVQAARLPGVDQVFALKRLRPDIADDPDFVRWFEPSARALASLRHDGVLPLHDYWREPGAAYLVTPRMPGGTLRDRIRRRSIDRRDVARVVERVGGGLEAADGAGLRHGRICAEKVLYDAHGDPVLGDFWLGQPDRSEADDRRDFIALIRECLATVPDAPAAASERLEAPLDERTGIADLVRELTEVLDGRARAAPRRANPYQGLRAFDEGDAAFYFGREALVRELCERLDGNDLVHRLVLLVGASGTGKSSVVRAGLLPQLRAGAITASGEWFVTVMVPGAAPLRRLAEALRTIAVRPVASWPGGTAWPVDQLARELRDEVGGLDRTLRLLVPSGGELLLVVDQLEELFTLSAEPDRRLFLDALVHALTAPGSRLRVVATLRADYYDRPLAYQAFGSMVDAATVAMPVMLPVEIEAAVVEPAKRAGRSIDRELVTELVGRLSAEPVALPALQFVLFALAERSGVGPLRMRDYHALGGLDGAIAARAEELYRSRDDEREQVRDMFERLVVVDREGEPTRRRVVRTELSAGSDIVDAWTKARLLTLDVHPQHRVPTVEVAHEALVREWPRLRDWLEQDRAELIVLGRLREAAAAWDELGREPSALYRGTSLEAALDVGRRRSLIERERDFLTASVRARAAERRSTDEMIARQARTNRRLRFQLAGIALALVGALAGGLLAVDQRGAAVRQRHLAVARELAAAADANLRDDPERSILLALAAVDATARHDEGVLPEATEALHRGVVSSRVVFSVPDAGGVVDWSSDGRYFTTEGVEESGMVDLYDARTGARVRSWRGDAVDLNDVSFSGDGRLLATSGDDGAVKVWSIPSGHLVARHGSSQRTSVWGPSLNRDGSLVAASWFWPGRVVVSDTRTGRVVHRLAVRMPEDTAFSPDGRFLAVVSERSEVVVFDLRTGRRVHSFRDAMEGIRDIAWSPDGRWLTAAASDGAYLFEGATGRFRFTTSGQISAVNGVAWSRDSGLLATGSNDGTAVVHRVDEHGAHELLSLSGQDLRNGVRSVAFSPRRHAAADRRLGDHRGQGLGHQEHGRRRDRERGGRRPPARPGVPDARRPRAVRHDRRAPPGAPVVRRGTPVGLAATSARAQGRPHRQGGHQPGRCPPRCRDGSRPGRGVGDPRRTDRAGPRSGMARGLGRGPRLEPRQQVAGRVDHVPPAGNGSGRRRHRPDGRTGHRAPGTVDAVGGPGRRSPAAHRPPQPPGRPSVAADPAVGLAHRPPGPPVRLACPRGRPGPHRGAGGHRATPRGHRRRVGPAHRRPPRHARGAHRAHRRHHVQRRRHQGRHQQLRRHRPDLGGPDRDPAHRFAGAVQDRHGERAVQPGRHPVAHRR